MDISRGLQPLHTVFSYATGLQVTLGIIHPGTKGHPQERRALRSPGEG